MQFAFYTLLRVLPPLAEGDTSHPCGYGPSCLGTSLDPEGRVNPMPLPPWLPCSPL